MDAAEIETSNRFIGSLLRLRRAELPARRLPMGIAGMLLFQKRLRHIRSLMNR
jgi:hypothetical protein